MEILIQLVNDIGKLWAKYGASYLTGMRNTLILALTATAIGCVIGFLCGVLNTIPCAPGDSPVKKFFLKLIRGGLPGHPHGAAGGVPVLRSSLFHKRCPAV